MIPQLANLQDNPEMVQLAAEWPLCLSFRLEPRELVIVAGAYEGRVIELLMRLYPGILVHGFDPQAWALDRALDRIVRMHETHPERLTIEGNLAAGGSVYMRTPSGGVTLHPYGLASRDVTVPMGEWNTDACSLFRPGQHETGEGHLREYATALAGAIQHVGLIVLNAEGAEFDLVPYWRQRGFLSGIRRLAIQWHMDLDADEALAWLDVAKPGEMAMNHILESNGFRYHQRLVHDERPAWTYSEKVPHVG